MDDLVFRLRKRAEIRRQIKTRKSVQEGQPDRISDLLEEAANRIEELENRYVKSYPIHSCDIPGCASCGNPPNTDEEYND